MRIFERSIAGLPAQPSTENATTSQDEIGSDCSLLGCTEEVSVALCASTQPDTATGHGQHPGSFIETLALQGISPSRDSGVVSEYRPRCKNAETTLSTTQTTQPCEKWCDYCGGELTCQHDESTGRQHQYQTDVTHNHVSSKDDASRHRCCNDEEATFNKSYLNRTLRHKNEYYHACCHVHQLLRNRRTSDCTSCENAKPVWTSRHATRSNESLYCQTDNSADVASTVTTTDNDLLWLPRVGEEDTSQNGSSTSIGGKPLAGGCISGYMSARDDCTGHDPSRECSNAGSQGDRETRIKRLQRQLNVLQKELLTLGGGDLEVTYF